MQTDSRAVVEAHWKFANTRDWARFTELIHPSLRYDVPQTREYIETGLGYSEMFATWPGDWVATIQHLVSEADKAICVTSFKTAQESMTGISILEVSEGRVIKVIDY